MVEGWVRYVIGNIDYKYYAPIFTELCIKSFWPFTIIFIVFWFRREIKRILESLESFEVFGAKGKTRDMKKDAGEDIKKDSIKISGNNEQLADPGVVKDIIDKLLPLGRDDEIPNDVSKMLDKFNASKKSLILLSALLFKFRVVWGSWEDNIDNNFCHAVEI